MNDKVLIHSINIVAGITALLTLLSAGRDLFFVITGVYGWSWEYDGLYIIESMVCVFVIALVLIMMNLSVNDLKPAVPAMIVLAALTIYSFDFAMLNCLILFIVWYKNRKHGTELTYEKTMKLSVILACITVFSAVVLPLLAAAGMMMLNGMGASWIMFTMGLQVFTFVLRPELVLMIYLRRQCSRDCNMPEELRAKIRKTTTVYFVIWAVIFAVMLVGCLADWSVNSLEAGDWEQWETE